MSARQPRPSTPIASMPAFLSGPRPWFRRAVVVRACVALVLSVGGCADLSVPDAATQVHVTRAAGDGAVLEVALSPARAEAVLPCLKQAEALEPGAAAGVALAEGVYAVELADASGARSVVRLESAWDLRTEDGRRFRTRCLYDLVRDRGVVRAFDVGGGDAAP